MELTAYEFTKLASVIKTAQTQEAPPKKKTRHRKTYDPAYLDYSKALTTQLRHRPEQAGAQRALGTGALGVVLGALLAKSLSDDPRALLAGAVGGGAIGAIPGYRSGKSEAESENTRINFLRRQGITRPGELEKMRAVSGEGAEDKAIQERREAHE
jgi:hypothetical protein